MKDQRNIQEYSCCIKHAECVSSFLADHAPRVICGGTRSDTTLDIPLDEVDRVQDTRFSPSFNVLITAATALLLCDSIYREAQNDCPAELRHTTANILLLRVLSVPTSSSRTYVVDCRSQDVYVPMFVAHVHLRMTVLFFIACCFDFTPKILAA